MQFIALYIETTALATLSKPSEINISEYNKNSGKRNLHETVTQFGAKTAGNIDVIHQHIFISFHRNKCFHFDICNNNVIEKRIKTTESITPNKSDIKLKSSANSNFVEDTIRLEAILEHEMNPQNITLQLPGTKIFANNFSDSNCSVVLERDAVSFDVGSERIVRDKCDNISMSDFIKMDTTERERDRKRKRYLSDEDYSRITRHKMQQQLLHQQGLSQTHQMEAQNRLVRVTDEGDKTTVLPKKPYPSSEFNPTNYGTNNIKSSSSDISDDETHAKKVLRSSIAGVKQETVTEVSKRSCASERKRSQQDEDASCRNQSKRSLIIKYRKRTVQKVTKKTDIAGSDCNEATSNDVHDKHADGCENELFNDNSISMKHEGEDMLEDQLGKQRLETDTSIVLDYNTFGIIIDNSSLKMRETSTNSPTQYTAGVFDNEEKEYINSSRFQSIQYVDHNKTGITDATTKTTPYNPRSWEENVSSNTVMQLSTQRQELNQHYVRQSTTLDIGTNEKQQNGNFHEFIEADRRSVAPYSTPIENTHITGPAQRVHNYRYDLMNAAGDRNERSATKTSPYVNRDVLQYEDATTISCCQHSNTNCNVTSAENSGSNIDDSDNGCTSENSDRESINCNKEQRYVSSQMQNMKDCNSQQSGYTVERASDSNSQQLALVASTFTNDISNGNISVMGSTDNLKEISHSSQPSCRRNENMERICDAYDRVDSASTNVKAGKNSNYDEQQGEAYIEKGEVRIYGLSLAETSKTKSSALKSVSTTATNVNNTSDNTTNTISTTATSTTTINTTNTTITEGCVSTNVTINKIPNTDDTKSDSSVTITTPATTVYADNIVGSCENDKHLAQVPSANTVNGSVLGESTYNLNNSQELRKTLSAHTSPQSASENLDNLNETWASTPNESYQRYNNSDNFSQTAVGGGSEACLSAGAQLCYKLTDDTCEKALKERHQQRTVNKQNVIEYTATKEHQLQHSKNHHEGDYLTRQPIDNSASLSATDVYNTELQLQQPRQGRHDIQHYMQEQLCQQIQQQRQQLHDHQQEELNCHQHQQQYPHDVSQVLQQISLHDYNLHGHSQQLHPLHDALRHNQTQHFEQQRQLEQRHDEEQQQHLIAYLHHTTEQTRPQQQLQHHEYHQQQQQFQQEQQHHHNQHQQQMQPNLLLIAKKRQHQQPHALTDLKHMNRPPPTCIDDLIIDEFSEDPHTSYKL